MQTAAAILAVLLILLCVPWRFEIRFGSRRQERVHFCLWQVCGSLPFEKTHWSRRGVHAMHSRAAEPEVFKETVVLLKKIMTAVRWDGTSCTLHFGFEDPAETGMLYGWLSSGHFAQSYGKYCRMLPEFSGPRLDLTGRIRVRFVPLVFMAVLVKALVQRWYNKKKKVQDA